MSAADKSGDEWRRYAAELIGTALLVLVGVGVAVLAPGAGALGIALAFGLVLTVLAYTIGPISGCHVNRRSPWACFGRADPPRRAAFYIIAQIVGVILGAALVLAVATTAPGTPRRPTAWEPTAGGRTPPAGTGSPPPPLWRSS